MDVGNLMMRASIPAERQFSAVSFQDDGEPWPEGEQDLVIQFLDEMSCPRAADAMFNTWVFARWSNGEHYICRRATWDKILSGRSLAEVFGKITKECAPDWITKTHET